MKRLSVMEFTPTPNPFPQGGGGFCRLSGFALKLEMLAGETPPKSPSPLWGGVRGGGTISPGCFESGANA